LDVTISTSDTLSLAHILGALGDAGFSVSPVLRLERTVLDTFDGRISAAGLRLEVREEHDQQLTLTGGGSAVAGVSIVGVPRVTGDLPPGPFRARLAKVLGVRALVPVISLTVCEATATKRDRAGKARVSISVHDQVAIAGHGPILGTYVEVRGVAGYAADFAGATELLRRWGLAPSDGDLVEAAAAATGRALGGFTISPTVPLRRGEPAYVAFRRLLVNLADTVDATWQGTVDDIDPEFLHDMRVAVRRTRSVLAQGKRVLPPPGRRSYGEAFRWLGTATSRPRDLDVYLLEWDRYVSPLGAGTAQALSPVRDLISAQRREAHATLGGVLRSDRYQDLMSGWHHWLNEAPARPSEQDADRPMGAVVTARTVAAQELVLAHGRSIGPDSPAEDLHELRKDAKKLRYLLECFGSLYQPSRRKAFVQVLKALQDNLGEHQDSEVHLGELRSIPAQLGGRAAAEPTTLVAIGQLTEQLEQRRKAARTEFAERFSAYDAKDTHSSFKKLLQSVGDRR